MSEIKNKRFYIAVRENAVTDENNKNKVIDEAADPTRALEIKKDSNAYAILYGWKYKTQPEVEIEPEEHDEDSLKMRIDQIVRDYNKYSYNGPRGNRYAKHSDFIFYVLYNNKGYKFRVNEHYYNESASRNTIDLEYDDLEVEVYTGSSSGYFDVSFGNWLPDDSSYTDSISWTYTVDQDDVEEFFFENADTTFEKDLLSEEELKMIKEMDDDDYEHFLIKYVEEHFDELVDKYYDDLLDYYRDWAEEDARENYEPDYYDGPDEDDYYDDYFDESLKLQEDKKKKKSKKGKRKKNQFGGRGPWLGWWQRFTQPDKLGKFDSVHHDVGNMEVNTKFFNHANGSDAGDVSVSDCGGDAGAGSGDAGAGAGAGGGL